MTTVESHQAESLTIEGLFDEHSVSLDLFDEPAEEQASRLRIIFDENGTGKTTVLRCLYHLMSWAELDSHLVSLAGLPLTTASVSFSGGAHITFARDEDDPALCSIEAAVNGETASLNYDAGRFDPRGRRRLIVGSSDAHGAYQEVASRICLPPIYVADDRSIRADDLFESPTSKRVVYTAPTGVREVREQRDRPDPSSELAYLFEELTRDFRRATLAQKRAGGEAVYADVVKRIAEETTLRASGDVEAMRKRAGRIRGQLDLAAEYNLTSVDQLDEVLETLNSLRRNHRNKKIIETVLDPFFTNLEAEVERITPGAERIHLFVSTVNSFLQEKGVAFSLSEGIGVMPSTSARSAALAPEELSSGERHLLLLLGSAMIAKNDRTIIIDEPELSLGIPWKRRLLSSLLSLTEESGARFLVASHSVEVITPFRVRTRNVRALPPT